MSALRYLFPAVLLVCATTVHAVRPAPTQAAAPQAAAAQATPAPADPPFELKNRSTFTGGEQATRAPFWPIGWVKRKAGVVAATVAAPAPKILLDEKSFRVTSILLGTGTTPSLAIINQRPYTEGEFIRMPKTPGTPSPRIRVQRINDGTVILQYADQVLVTSLLRPELNSRRPEELLLDPDR